jgi:hypothetical protein
VVCDARRRDSSVDALISLVEFVSRSISLREKEFSS